MPHSTADLAALRTRLAQKFVCLADTVTDGFGDFHIGGGDYTVELTTPKEMSTGGGKRALQHLCLVPRRVGFAAIVAGTVNAVEKSAQLRAWEHVFLVHEARFGKPIDITDAEWRTFLDTAVVVLEAAGIDTSLSPVPPEVLALRRMNAKRKRVSPAGLGAFAAVVVVASIVVWRVALVLAHT